MTTVVCLDGKPYGGLCIARAGEMGRMIGDLDDQMSVDNEAAAWLLEYLETALEDSAEVIDEWDELSCDEQLDYWAEWPLKEDKLAQLDRLAESNRLSASQASRHRAIKQRLFTHRAALDRLYRAEQPITQGA